MLKRRQLQGAALVAALCATAAAHAVNVNPNGLGEVLLYPLYTAEEGNLTAVHITNTTDAIKAVKVRFLEGMNSRTVLDFNLYLAPYDVWTGGVIQTAEGAALISDDQSCMTGASSDQPFVTSQFDGSVVVPNTTLTRRDSVHGADRTRLGHAEVFEMGEVDPAVWIVAAPTPVTAGEAIMRGASDLPGNCDAIRSAWGAGGVWSANPSAGLSRPTGGLSGTATIINVEKGIEFSAEVTALDNFSTAPLHRPPGDASPNLSDSVRSAGFANGSSRTYKKGIDAVSAVLMKESIRNDFVHGAGLNAKTDLVITYPTKAFYINTGGKVDASRDYIANPPVEPFTMGWSVDESKACELFSSSYHGREEAVMDMQDWYTFPSLPIVFRRYILCYAANIVGTNDGRVLGGRHTRIGLDLKSEIQTGWIRIDQTGTYSTITRQIRDTSEAVTHLGLPIIGFAVIQIENGDVGGLLSNYAAAYVHKANVTLVSP